MITINLVAQDEVDTITRALSVLSDKLLEDACNYPAQRATYVRESEKVLKVRRKVVTGVRS